MLFWMTRKTPTLMRFAILLATVSRTLVHRNTLMNSKFCSYLSHLVIHFKLLVINKRLSTFAPSVLFSGCRNSFNIVNNKDNINPRILSDISILHPIKFEGSGVAQKSGASSQRSKKGSLGHVWHVYNLNLHLFLENYSDR